MENLSEYLILGIEDDNCHVISEHLDTHVDKVSDSSYDITIVLSKPIKSHDMTIVL